MLVISVQKRNVLDAIRIKDDSRVVLKYVLAKGNEHQIALYLSTSQLRSDPRNRTVPLVEVISLPSDNDHVLLVMPYLRVFNKPRFHCRGEVIDALRQFLQVSCVWLPLWVYLLIVVLQGLEFMHEHSIAHRYGH